MKPPSMIISAPVMNDDSSEARKSAALAMSRGWPIRPSGNRRLELRPELVVEVGRLQRCLDDTRMDDIGPDLVPRELDGERLVERDEGALGRGIGVLGAGESRERRHRADEDDGPAARGLQVRDPVLGHPEHRLQIDGHHAVPLGAVRLQHRAVAVLPEHAGVVVEHVERAEAPHAIGHHARHVGLDGDVAHRRERLPAHLGHDLHRVLAAARAVHVAHDDARAFLREQDGRRPAHAHARARDERHFPVESIAHAIGSSS